MGGMQTNLHNAPPDPIVAVTHSNPYPYYGTLVNDKPIYRDAQLGFWVASSSDTVTSVLTSSLCRVRPVKEPVPATLLGSPAADIFRYLVRMNDGDTHQPFKKVILSSMKTMDNHQLIELSRRWAGWLLETIKPQTNDSQLQDFIFHLPMYVVASLLGISSDRLPQVVVWIDNFVKCLAPNCRAEQIDQGKLAAEYLLELFHSLFPVRENGHLHGFLSTLSQEAQHIGYEYTNAIIANGIGFLSQAYEATAGLIGNTLLALSAHRISRQQVLADFDLLPHIIQEVLRYDPAIQNTRRFVGKGGIVAGQHMHEGETILVVLAAANRDAAVNPDPDRFEIHRANRRIFTFGLGDHACPGTMLAATIARAGIEQLLASGLDPKSLNEAVIYRPSVNARIPILGAREISV